MAKGVAWVKVAESLAELSFGPNALTEVMAGDKKVCLGLYNNELYAFPPTCPHAGGRFADGFVDALGNVVCPLHRYKFCMKNGRNVSGEGYYLKHWPVETREDGVYVGLQAGGFFGLF